MKKKIVRWTAAIFALIVIVFHICWFYNYFLFTKFTDGLNEFKKFVTFSILEENYVYHVKLPSYLTFTGNLAVSNGNGEYSLIIWPSRFQDTKYGVRIPIENEATVSIMISRDLEAEDEYDQPIVDESREHILDLFEKASKRWGTDFE